MPKVQNVKVRLNGQKHGYQISIGHRILEQSGAIEKTFNKNTERVVIVSNPKVYGLYGETVKNKFLSAGFEVFVWLMKDGEKHKNLQSVQQLLKFVGEHHFKRTDVFVALGGGVVGDLAGFAAAVYLRGVSFLQIPTTFLSMIDSSVGGKTGVNTTFGKNLVGAFHQPVGVLIDTSVLQTLPKRELTAGFCEAVKHGALAGGKLFNNTADFLQKYPVNKFKKLMIDEKAEFVRDLNELLKSQIEFKAEIVIGDERETALRTDQKSRKILNFGHTLGHALEKATDFRHFKHGEAVGYGIIFSAELSKKLELLSENSLKLLNFVVRLAGQLPRLHDLSVEKIIEGFSADKKNIGDDLQWILLKELGSPVVVSGKNIPENLIRQCLEKILKSNK